MSRRRTVSRSFQLIAIARGTGDRNACFDVVVSVIVCTVECTRTARVHRFSLTPAESTIRERMSGAAPNQVLRWKLSPQHRLHITRAHLDVNATSRAVCKAPCTCSTSQDRLRPCASFDSEHQPGVQPPWSYGVELRPRHCRSHHGRR